MEDNLKNLLNSAIEKDEESIVKIINLLNPMLRKYGRLAGYDEAETDLVIFLLESLNRMDVKNIDSYNEGQLFSYFKTILYRKAIDLYRHHLNQKQNEILDCEIEVKEVDQPFSDIFFYDLVCNLNFKQQQVIIGKIMFGLSDVQLAKSLHISRQAVNRLYNRALKKLKEEVDD